MATHNRREMEDDPPEDPDDLLPEDSTLSLDEYLDMHRIIGHRDRYEIVYRLLRGEKSPKQLEEEMDVDDSTLHYHLKKLLDAHLIEKWKRTEKDQDGLSTFYRPTVYGEVVLTEGVDTLIRAEHEFEAMYDSSADGA